MQLQTGTGKMGRGGGGGGGSAGKKTITTPSINRPASGGRLSMGGGSRGRGGASSAAISSPTAGSLRVEESFSLVRENPLNFGIAIKLAPDLVEEIRRVEAQGATARIKFDANAKNPNGNVIHAGDKIFKFTWSREPGDLCDIYEELRSGEDGNGLLLESGGTWRKLNVERELDDSTKNHVKRLSEEAERKQKSRKAIVLDHQNPSMKNQIKSAANVGSHPWKTLKSRKEPPFKKMKPEPPSGGTPLTFSKSGSSTTPISKTNLFSGSPLLSLQEQHGPQASPSGHALRGHASTTDVIPTNSIKRISADNDTLSRPPSTTAGELTKQKCRTEVTPSDSRGLMISLFLGQQDKGMTFKDLERALGDAFPNSALEIEHTLKRIAVYHASGKYVLKPEVEIEFLNKQLSQSQSSPGINHHQALEFQQFFNNLSSQDPSSVIGAAAKDELKYEFGASPVLTTVDVEKIDILSNSPEHSNEKKISNNNDDMLGSSSDSRSGSGSESDSSESESDSGSHSRSKSRSLRQSRSASSTDTSISSKQASDEDVDIMTGDDDKESIHRLQAYGMTSLKSPIDIGDYGKHDGVFDNAEGQEANYLFHNEEGEEPIGISSIGESKRQFDDTKCEEKTGDRKRFKSRNSNHPVSGTLNSIFGESPSNSSPDTPVESPDKVADSVTDRNGTTHPAVPSGFIPNLYISDTQKGFRSSEASASTETSSGRRRRPSKNDTLVPTVLISEKAQSATQLPYGVGDKLSTLAGSIKEARSHDVHLSKVNNENIGRSSVMGGRQNPLQRELSDLELGELRETVYDESSVEVLSKQLENRSMDLGCDNSDLNQGKPYDKLTTDVGKLSPRNQAAAFSTIADAASKRKVTDHSADKIEPHLKGSQPQHQQNQSSGDFVEVGTSTKIKAKHREVRSQGATTTVPANKVSKDSDEKLHDTAGVSGARVTKISKKQKPGTVGQPNGKTKTLSMKGGNKVGPENKESSDEITRWCMKYEKEQPDLKEPIKDASQYEKYVKEYQEKHESYSLLTRTLRSYRNEFSKLGDDLEACKGRDTKRYHDKLNQMMSYYHECGERHKRMKKVFLLLHEELRHLKQMIKDFAASYKKK